MRLDIPQPFLRVWRWREGVDYFFLFGYGFYSFYIIFTILAFISWVKLICNECSLLSSSKYCGPTLGWVGKQKTLPKILFSSTTMILLTPSLLACLTINSKIPWKFHALPSLTSITHPKLSSSNAWGTISILMSTLFASNAHEIVLLEIWISKKCPTNQQLITSQVCTTYYFTWFLWATTMKHNIRHWDGALRTNQL